jgi:hypothetical protein
MPTANNSTNRSQDQAQQIGNNVDYSNESRLLQSYFDRHGVNNGNILD